MRSRSREVPFLVLTLLAVVPLWLVARPPSQDWPQHVAAVRVLADHADPALRMVDAVHIDLARTQYVGFYLVAALLAKLLGAAAAVKLLISATLIAIPYGVRAILRESGGDERYAPFAVALTYNAHVIIGFLSFLAGIPVALFAVHAALRYRRAPSIARGIVLALLLVALFYLHVMPFAFALLAIALVVTGCSWRALLGAVAAVLPALALALSWSSHSEAGGSTLGLLLATLKHENAGETLFEPFDKTVRELPEWLTDVLPGWLDIATLAAALLVMLAGAAFARTREPEPIATPRSSRFVMVLPLVALLGTFLLPVQHGWIWPISSRLPYLFVLTLPFVLPRMRQRVGDLFMTLLVVLALVHVATVGVAFRKTQRETRGFEGALAEIPDGARVLGLMYGAASKYVSHFAYMHAQGYVQGEHGGVVMYSFAELPQSPFVYAPPPAGPPPLNLGVGWASQNADMRVAATYFEYCIAHGEHPHLAAVRRFYDRVYDVNGWAVYKRR